MISLVVANTPQWVVDAKNYLGFGASAVAAFGLVWKYAIKPYLQWREQERKRDIADAAALRKAEIESAIRPLQDTINETADVAKRTADKMILQGDAIHGINSQIAELTREQQSLHQDVRDHMRTEDAQRGKDNGP